MAEKPIDQIVQDHERRISDLEKNYAEVEIKLTNVNNSQLRIENTLLNESREQKALLNKLIDHQFGINKINITGKWQFWVAAVGSGGIFFLLVEAFTK